MKKIRFLLTVFVFFVFVSCANASTPWVNNLRNMFINNVAVIYTINIRSFGAVDYNKNDIIELELGEVSGTFSNAAPKLKKLASMGINTIYLLPVTKTGKLKALGTAGSLYAMDSFDALNPQLLDKTDLVPDIKTQAKNFIKEAHKNGLHVIVDLPSCGSYDMSLEKPDLFLKDKDGAAIVPADWTDVRLFRVYNDDKTLNRNLVDEYKKFINLMQELGVDGIRADVAAIKPQEFWKEIIDYARDKDPQFLFLAEASSKWTNPAKGYVTYTSVEDLLKAGFDGFYSEWSNLKEIKNSSDFHKKIQDDMKILEQFEGQKSMIANFATHDQTSPVVMGGYPYWQMVNWLNMTLPLNPYILDGFPYADPYIYKYENKKADKSYTDDDTYFVHRGKFDIFNFSRPPLNDIPNSLHKKEFDDSIRSRYLLLGMISTKEIEPLKTDNSNVFAFRKQNGNESLVVVGNLDIKSDQKVKVKIPKFSADDFVMPVKMQEAPLAKKGSLTMVLKPYEIQVYAIKKITKIKK